MTNWLLTGSVLLLLIFGYGIGLTLLLLPARWRRFWPAFCALVGLALQSAVVWAGVHLPALGGGTDRYAVGSLVVPVGFFAWAVARLGWRTTRGLLLHGARRWLGVALLMAISLACQVAPLVRHPMLQPRPFLTSVSLGSCDAADYAAGARVFKEFRRGERVGFLGQTEETRIQGASDFYEYWLRLNHFTPSALLALHGSLIGHAPHKLATLLGVVLLVVNLPTVFWLARAGLGYRAAGAGAVTLIYAFNPLVLYAVYQTALGQLLAAPAVALLTWAGWQAFRGAWRGWGAVALWQWSGLLLVANWIVLGSYHFFLPFAYAPLLARVGLQTFVRWHSRTLGAWCVFVGASLLACTLLFPARIFSLAERYARFRESDFGWAIPPFRPEGWFGWFADSQLSPVSGWLPVLIGLALLYVLGREAVLGWRTWSHGDRWRLGRPWIFAAALSVPALVGYGLLLWLAARRGGNGSYDAYKLFAVFYPGLLASGCLWLRRWPFRRPTFLTPVGAGILAAAVLLANLEGAWRMDDAVRRSRLVLDQPLIGLSRIETMPEIASVNICLEPYWQRLWAHALLLRKPQYFSLPTYEGRRVTALRGDWDLREGFLAVRPPGENDCVELNPGFRLVAARTDPNIGVQLGTGWYPPEHHNMEFWCWAAAAAPEVRVLNPGSAQLQATVRLHLLSADAGPLRILVNDVAVGETALPPAQHTLVNAELLLNPGRNILRLETSTSQTRAGDGILAGAPDRPADARVLTLALYGLEIHVHTAAPTPALPGAAVSQP